VNNQRAEKKGTNDNNHVKSLQKAEVKSNKK